MRASKPNPNPSRPPPLDPAERLKERYMSAYDKYKNERYKYPIFIQAYEDFENENKECNNTECTRRVRRYAQILLDAYSDLPDTPLSISERSLYITQENTYRKEQINEPQCSCIKKRPVRKTIVYNDPNSHIADSSKGALRFMQDNANGRVYIEKGFKDAKKASSLLDAEHNGYHSIRHALRNSKQRAMMESYQYPTFSIKNESSSIKNESSSISMDKMGEIGILGWLKKCKRELYNTEEIEDIKNLKTEIRKSIEYIIDQLKMFVVGINSENVFHCDLHPENIMVTYDHTKTSYVTDVFIIDFELTRNIECNGYRAITSKFGAAFIMTLAAITKSVYFDISKHQSIVVDDNKVKVGQKFRTDNNMSDHAMLHSIMALFLYKYNRMTKETYIFDRGSTVLDITGKDAFIKKYSK
jgi:thiamine kinase-like enzyme